MSIGSNGPRPDVGYDLRRGAGGYAQILSTFGALAIPSIIVVFTLRGDHPLTADQELKIVGYLCLTIIGSVGSAFGFAALAAERERTPNLAPAIMAVSFPATVTFVTLFSAVAVLVEHYLHTSGPVFVGLVAVSGILGIYLTAATLVDSVFFVRNPALQRNQQWPHDVDHAARHFWRLSGTGIVVVVLAVILRLQDWYLLNSATAFSVYLPVVAVAVIVAVGFGVSRAQHDKNGQSDGTGPVEAYLLCGAAMVFTACTILTNPA